MKLATTCFLGCPLPCHSPSLSKWKCSFADEASGGQGLSAIDRQYLDKVRARLLHTGQKRHASRTSSSSSSSNVDSDADFTSALPDDEDAIDDILFDRSPKNMQQVRMFGAWLDESVAGRKADKRLYPTDTATEGQDDEDSSVESHRPVGSTKEQAVETAQMIFTQAMFLFSKGQYKQAIGVYAQAVEAVGVGSRLGGQYQLWRAQALDAAGRKGDAATMLDALRMHADSDVRKVSRELHFIVTAPALELDPGVFLDVPTLDEKASNPYGGVLTSNFGPLRTALVDKKPEQYSLEWYMEKERPPKSKDNSAMEALLVMSAIFCTLAFMLASPS